MPKDAADSSRTSSRRSDGLSSSSKEKYSSESIDDNIVKALKHIDTFYEAPPPGMVRDEEEERPEDCIPDRPENQTARDFLASAPSKGLWMPLGKEVKVMQCWKCKAYGHRSGDKECPYFMTGNKKAEVFRRAHEDPMFEFVQESAKEKKQERIRQLQALLDSDTSDSETEKSRKKRKKKEKKSDKDSSSSDTKKPKKDKKHKKRKTRSEKPDPKDLNPKDLDPKVDIMESAQISIV